MVDKGVPAGLKIWLVFLIGFILLGYPIIPSIVFGAVTGLAGGMLTAWWNTPGGEPKPQPKPESAKPEPSRALFTISDQMTERLKAGRKTVLAPLTRVFTRRERRYTPPPRRTIRRG